MQRWSDFDFEHWLFFTLTLTEERKISEEKGETHTDKLISDSGKCLVFHSKAKIDMSWVNFSEYTLAQNYIDPCQIKFCSEIEKLHFSDSQIGMCFSLHIFIFSVLKYPNYEKKSFLQTILNEISFLWSKICT